MRNKMINIVCLFIVFVPWTILPLRSNFQWALDYAEIMIPCYAVFMIFGGVFTILSYINAKAQNALMKICLVINGIYAFFGILVVAMMVTQQI